MMLVGSREPQTVVINGLSDAVHLADFAGEDAVIHVEPQEDAPGLVNAHVKLPSVQSTKEFLVMLGWDASGPQIQRVASLLPFKPAG